VALGLLNVLGVGKVSGLQIAVVGFIVVALLGFSGLGLGSADTSLLSPAFPEGVQGVLGAAGLVFVSYTGVTKVCSVAEEIRHPKRNIPLGMLAAILTSMLLYAGVATVITANVPYETLAGDTTPVATAALAFLGPTGGLAFAGVAVLGLVSMSNAGVLASTRFPFAMARDGVLPEPISRVTHRWGTPVIAILVTVALLLVLVVGLPVYQLAKLASAVKILVFALMNVSVIVLREAHPQWYRPTFRSPLYPWTQLLGILGGVVLLANMGLLAVAGVVATLVLGTAWYHGYAARRIERRSAFQHLVGRFDAQHLGPSPVAEQEARPPRVVVPVFGGEPAPRRLVRLAAAFVDHGVLEILRLEEVAPQVPLGKASTSDAGDPCLARAARAVGEDAHVEVDYREVVTHNAKEALHQHVREACAAWIVMERPSRRHLRYLVRHPMAWWIDHPPCDLAVFLDRGGEGDEDTADDLRRILVLASPGPHDSLVVHVADRLAESQRRGRLTLFEPLPRDADDEEVTRRQDYHAQLALQCRCQRVQSIVFRTADPYLAVQDLSRDHDLLVLGAPAERSIRNLFFESSAHRFAERSCCSALVLKAPRHLVHAHFGFADETTAEALRIEPYIAEAVALPHLPAPRAAHVFRTIAERLGAECEVPPEVLERKLWEREGMQTTALPMGVSVTGPLVPELDRVILGLFTAAEQVVLPAPGRPQVDVVLVVAAPLRERQVQTWLLSHLSELAVQGDLLERLREAPTSEAMRNAVRRAERRWAGLEPDPRWESP